MAGDDVENALYDRQSSAGNTTEFVFGGEVRENAAFEVTRDISIVVGVEFLEFARGIGRSNSLPQNDEDVTMFGINVGAIING